MTFEEFVRKYAGKDPSEIDDSVRSRLREIYETYVAKRQEPATVIERYNTVLGTARAAVATASETVKAGLLEHAMTLASDNEITVDEAQRKITEKLKELVKADAGTRETGVADDQRTDVEYAVPTDPNAVLGRQEIVSALGEERDDRSVYDAAARSLIHHMEHGNPMPSERLFKDLEGRTGQLVIHDEVGSPRRRTVTASSANVAIQTVSTMLLQRTYNELPDRTDALVTTIPGGAAEVTFPEVETEEGVKRLKENEPYPFLGGADREVKSGHVKYGAAVSQSRENSLFDKLGRFMIYITSLSRQLKRHRREFRLARVCDSNSLDGRYIARPGNSEGSSAFYSATEDHRGNANLIASNGLADETDIDAVVQQLEGMQLTDGTNVMPELRVVLVDSSKRATAWKILNAIYAPSIAAASQTLQTLIPNPYGPEGMYQERPVIISDPKVGTYAGAATTWFAGDPKGQFYEIEHWGVEVVPVLTDGSMQLRDIVNAWKGGFCIDLIALSNMFFVKNTA